MKRFCLFVSIFLASCSGISESTKTNLINAPYQEILIAISYILDREGYQPKVFDEEKGTIETDWKDETSATMKTGRRLKLKLTIEKTSKGYAVNVWASSQGEQKGLTGFFENQNEPEAAARIAELINLKFATLK